MMVLKLETQGHVCEEQGLYTAPPPQLHNCYRFLCALTDDIKFFDVQLLKMKQLESRGSGKNLHLETPISCLQRPSYHLSSGPNKQIRRQCCPEEKVKADSVDMNIHARQDKKKHK